MIFNLLDVVENLAQVSFEIGITEVKMSYCRSVNSKNWIELDKER